MTATHILTYAQRLDGGGVERAMLRLVAGWVGTGRRVTLVHGAKGSAEIPDGVEAIALDSAEHRALLALPTIVRACAPDVIFCPGNHYTGIAGWTRVRLGGRCPPIVAKMSNAPHRRDHGAAMAVAHRFWLAAHGRFLDRLVAMTPATAAEAATALRMGGRTSVIANPPLDPSDAPPPSLPAGRFLIGIGRLEAQKRWDRLIDAMPRLADRAVPLMIFGEGRLRAELESQIRALGLEDRVWLPGETAAPLAGMARAALLVLPSDFEGTPGVLREALSVGTPVVATDSSASIAEIVDDPALGTIVARGDPDALVAAIDHWLSPATARPVPRPQPGADSVARYLTLFDSLTA